MDDSGIVDLFLGRDEAAINETALKYGSRLRTLAFGIVRDKGTAEDTGVISHIIDCAEGIFIFSREAYPGAADARSLDDIEKYVIKMLSGTE